MRALSLAALTLAVATIGGPAVAATFIFTTSLSGPAEEPPNASTGTGSSTLVWDDVARTFDLDATFSGLTAPTTIAHVHAPTALPRAGTAGVATPLPSFPGFPEGVTSGNYSIVLNSLDAASYNPAFVTASGGTVEAAEAAFVSALFAGQAYLNIHSTAFPAGEIRGFYAVIPEPATWALTITGFALVGGAIRARRRAAAALTT